MHATGCAGTNDEVLYIEHVQMLVSLQYSRRGDLVAYLTSPMGTKSCLLSPRKEDTSDEGFTKWPFMTTHNWGEDPRGVWTLEISDLSGNQANHGTLTEWQLIIHGTKEKPNHQNVTHPSKARDSVPVPVTTLSFRPSNQVPGGPTYTFGPPPPRTKVPPPPQTNLHPAPPPAPVQKPVNPYVPLRPRPEVAAQPSQLSAVNRRPLAPQLPAQSVYSAPVPVRKYRPPVNNYMAQQTPNYNYQYQPQGVQYNKQQKLGYRPYDWAADYAARYAAYSYYRTLAAHLHLRRHAAARKNKLRGLGRS